MTAKSGSEHAARARAMAAGADHGLTRLELLYLGHVASWGGTCWQTDEAVKWEISRPDGKRYHRESIARVRRFLARQSILRSERIFQGGKIPDPKAKYPSARGTTYNVIQWRELGIKNPMARAERRRRRMELAAKVRDGVVLQQREERRQQLEYERSVTGGQRAPTSPPPTSRPLGFLDAETQRYVDQVKAALERTWTAPESAGPEPVPSGAAERGPPE